MTEDLVAALAAIGIMVLPLAEVVLRRFFNTGVPGAAPFTSHLTLVVGLIGASIAAREGKLLALATGTMVPEGRPRHLAGILAAFVAALVTTILALGGVRLLQVHYAAGKEIALGVPTWVADLTFPIAFGLIALRLVWKSSPIMIGRALAALGIVAGAWMSTHSELLLDQSGWPWIAILVGAAILGHSAVYDCRVFTRRGARVGSTPPSFSSVLRLGAWRYCCRDDDPVRVLHTPNRGIRRHDSRAGRTADARTRRRRL